MTLRSRLFFPLLLAVFLAACTMSMAQEAPLPTPIPTDYLPTAIALTAQVLASPTAPPAATAAVTASPTMPPGTPTPTAYPIALPSATPTPPPTLGTPGEGYAILQILQPGMDSRVTSPITAQFAVQTGYTDAVRIELVGEDGAVLYRRIIRLDEDQPPHGLLYLNMEIPFEVRATAEVGRLQISAKDEFGRPLAQNAVPLALLSVGNAQVSYRTADHAPILLKDPRPYQHVEGGQVMILGKALPTGASAIEGRLIDFRGKVLAYATAPLSTPAEDGYALFAMSIPYNVNEATRVRLIVQESGLVPPGLAYLVSMPITIAP